MYTLVSLHVETRSTVTCRVTHLNAQGEVATEDGEPLDQFTMPPEERPDVRHRGTIVPANPVVGDTILFELTKVTPTGADGAGYTWEASICEAYGQSHLPDPLLFKATVPFQTVDDISDCPNAEVIEARARKVGPRAFAWVVQADALGGT